MINESGQGLAGGYRAIRQVAGGAESPWAGMLTSTAHGELGVLVDAADLPEKWRGWDAAASGHLLAPLDVLRRTGGHDVLLPVCTERVADFIDRRCGALSSLTAGEVVTLAVSVLRGVAELGEDADAVTGAWWLSETGRPVLATDCTDDPAAQNTAALLAALLGCAPALERGLRLATESLARGSVAREIDHLEDLLFAVDAPAPLAVTAFGPKSARIRDRIADEPSRADAAPERPGVIGGLARHLDTEWADVVSRTMTGVWRAVRTRKPSSRRAPWMLAAGIAGLVIIGGLMWPFEERTPAIADVTDVTAVPETPAPTPPSPASSSDGGVADEAEVVVSDDDLPAVTAALLSARNDCQAQPECLSRVQESTTTTFTTGVIDLDGADRTVTLLDEFGGVAVLRVDAASTASQLVVIVRIDGKWLLRDVHDVAQQ